MNEQEIVSILEKMFPEIDRDILEKIALIFLEKHVVGPVDESAVRNFFQNHDPLDLVTLPE